MLIRSRLLVLALALTAAFLPFRADGGESADAPEKFEPVLGGHTRVVVRDLPALAAADAGQAEREVEARRLPGEGVRAQGPAPARWAAVSQADVSLAGREGLQPLAPPTLASSLAFEGLQEADNVALTSTITTPPDPQLAVGDDYVVEFVNIVGRIYDKASPHSAVDSFALADFFGVPGTWHDFDPKIIYDALTDRWFASYGSRIDNPGASTDFGRLHLAVSATSDPTGAWDVYFLEYNEVFPDYPGIGLTDDKFTVSSNLFDIDGLAIDPACSATSGFCGVHTVVVQKSDMLAGDPSPTISTFAATRTRFTVRPAHSLTSVSDQWLATYDLGSFDQMTVIRITGTPDAANVAEASATDLTVAFQNSPPNSLTAGGGNIDSGDFRLLEAVWRSGSLWTSASAVCNASFSCAHLSEVDTGSLAVDQDIMYGASGEYYSWPAVRTDASGDLYMSVTHTSTSIFAEARAAGRMSGDPVNTMTGSVLLRAGEVIHTSGRWGDYLGAAVDPAQPECVWVVGEYAKNTVGNDWGTYIGALSYSDGCDSDGDGVPDASDACPGFDDSVDSDGDGVPDGCDVCPGFDDTIDFDSDGIPDDCDADDDGDFFSDAAEAACGSGPLDGGSVPERLGNAADDDGDGPVDEAQAAVAGQDCDGDGFKDDLEGILTWPPAVASPEAACANFLDDDGDGVVNDGCAEPGTGHQERCADSTSSSNEDDDQWPADFNDDGRLNLQDVNSFASPVRHFQSMPLSDHGRWNLGGGPSINLADVNQLSTLSPPMFQGQRAWGNPMWGSAGLCPPD